MIEIKFSGQTVDEVREQIQKFAVMHLTANIGGVQIQNGEVKAPDLPSSEEVLADMTEREAHYTVAPPVVLGGEPKKRRRRTKAEMEADTAREQELLRKHQAEVQGPPKNVTPPQSSANAPQRVANDTPAAMTQPAAEKPASAAPGAFFEASAAPPVAQTPPAAQTPPVTMDEVTASLTAVWNKHGMEKSLEVLSRFGVKRARELLPEQWSAFVGYCKEAL